MSFNFTLNTEEFRRGNYNKTTDSEWSIVEFDPDKHEPLVDQLTELRNALDDQEEEVLKKRGIRFRSGGNADYDDSKKYWSKKVKNGTTVYMLLDKNKKTVGGFITSTAECDYADTIQIGNLYISERLRGQGMGRMLMNNVKNAAKHSGFKYIFLGCMADNKAALNLYESMNFTPISYGLVTDL